LYGTAESVAETDKLFNGLVVDGTVTIPLENTCWGAYFGIVIDKFGISWMISYAAKYQAS
jgi:PhnB protein